jgi:hypothetical protein
MLQYDRSNYAVLIATALACSQVTACKDKGQDGAQGGSAFDPTALPESMIGSWTHSEGHGYQRELLVGPTTLSLEKWSGNVISKIKWTCKSSTSCSFTGHASYHRSDEIANDCSGTISLVRGNLIIEATTTGKNKRGPDVQAGASADPEHICETMNESYTRAGETPGTTERAARPTN